MLDHNNHKKASSQIYICPLLWVNSSVGKESICNEGDPRSIPQSGRSAREGISYPLPRFGASLVAQLVKNLPAMQETWVQSLGWEDPLEKGKATHPSILAWRISWTTVHGVTKSQIRLSDFHFHFYHELEFLFSQFHQNVPLYLYFTHAF